MLFSGKENVFMCLAVTKFVLWKINFGVWFIQTFLQKMHQIRQKKQNLAKENESISHSFTKETKPSKKIHQIRSNWDHAAEEKMRSRGEGDIERRRGRCDRLTSGAIDDRSVRSHRSRSSIASLVSTVRSLDKRRDLGSLSLSLSLFSKMNWSENKGVK